MVLGDEYSSDIGVSASRAEREALVEAFAAELLLPVEAVRRAGEAKATSRSILVKLAAEYRTSWTLALRQARNAELITPPEERELRGCLPTHAEFRDSLGWTPQPDLNAIRVPPSFAHAVMTAYRQGRITSKRALELMHGQLESTSDLPPRLEEDDAP
ncbi:ImmA/IrrE family metallo-endopeptidase [Sinosporangium album]|uniref:ImmA/IrrE family metallo-endopeptidase n=1 Tax=Sinosporangium album TaxID=504805 RepID=UPI001FE13B21|nr:hypothetical protein [Sinosporangium album]